MPSSPPVFRPAHLQSRQVQRKGYERERREREPWRNWYKLKQWLDLRAHQLRREPLCESCLIDEERITGAEVVHHREPHRGDRAKFFDPSNLASVCKPCHDGEIQRGERAGWSERGWLIEGHKIPARVMQPLGLSPSAVPLVMVCGPPGAGKSTYVSAHAGPDDILIDIDAILGELSGTEQRTQVRRDRHLFDAFMERNRRLAALGTETRPAKAWFIIGSPRASMRELWADQLKPQDVVVFETTLSVCRDRIRCTPSRAETAEGMIEGVAAWWNRYERSPCDTQYVEI